MNFLFSCVLCCRYLVESLQKCYLLSKNVPKGLDTYSKETTPFNQIFGGYMRQVRLASFSSVLWSRSNLDRLMVLLPAPGLASGSGKNIFLHKLKQKEQF